MNTALRRKVGCPIPFVRLYPGRKLEIKTRFLKGTDKLS